MANQITYEYLFTLIDKISPEIIKISRQIDKMEKAFEGSQKKMQESTQKTISKMDMLIQKTKKMGDNMKNAGSNISSFGAKGLFASVPTGLFAKNAYKEFASYDALLLQMRTTFGETADAMIKEGNRIADSTALGPQQAFQLLSKIKQTGSLNNQEIIKVTNDLINTVYGVGASKQFDRIAWQFTQVLTKGELELEDLKTIAEAGVPIFTMLGDTLGKTPQQILDIIGQQGVIGVSAQNVVDMLDKYGKIHKDAQVKFANSAEGKLQILSETYSKFSRKFGEMMESAGYGDMIVSLTKFFNFLSDKIDNMSLGAKKFTFYFTLLAVTLPAILLTVGTLLLIFGNLFKVVGGIFRTFQLMWKFSSWIGNLKIVKSLFSDVKGMLVFSKDIMLRMVGITKEMGQAILKNIVSAWNKVGDAIMLANAKMKIFNTSTLANPLIRAASVLMGVWDTMTDTDKIMANVDKARREKDIGKSSFAMYDLTNRSPNQSQPLQSMLQIQTINNNTTTQGLHHTIDINANGFPKGSEVKTQTSNVPRGMSVATNYNLGF